MMSLPHIAHVEFTVDWTTVNSVNWIALSVIKYGVLFFGAWVTAGFVVDATSVSSYEGIEVWRGLKFFLFGVSLLQGLPSVAWLIVAHVLSLKRAQVSVHAALSWGIFLPPVIFLLMGGIWPFLLQAAVQGAFIFWVKDFDPRRRY